MEHVLVTGGAGYKGSLLVPRLLEKGYQVTVLDNFMFGIKPILHFANHPNVSFINGDVRDKRVVATAMKNADIIHHLAAIVGYPACSADPQVAESVNVDGTRNICENLSQNQRLIFASTGSTYGKVKATCTEETPINPLSLYGKTKWIAEQLVTDKGGVGLRFATVFGLSPRLRLDLLVNDFVHQAIHLKQIILYNSNWRRTFLHVRDAAESYLFTMDNFDRMSGRAFNVGDEKMNYTKLDIALAVRKKVDYYLHEAEIGEDLDQRDYEVSYQRIRDLGYKATVTLDEGIDELAKILPHLQVVSEWRNA